MAFSISDNFGFSSKAYIQNRGYDEDKNKVEESYDDNTPHMDKVLGNTNTYNIMGYIPIIGAIIGIFKRIVPMIQEIKEYSSSPEKMKNFYSFQIFRATCETLGMGFLFLIPDIIATIGKMCSGPFFKRPGVDYSKPYDNE